MRRAAFALLAPALLLAALAVAAVVWLNLRGDNDEGPVTAPPLAERSNAVARGAYLALAGDCAACHTARGGAPYAGGRAIDTPFGAVYASNLTPDDATGLGRWSAAEFRRALRHGRSRDGRLLTPVFPYENYSKVSDADADALYSYLRSLPAVAQAVPPNALRFPYGTQTALALWRALYFRAGAFKADASKPADWNRGAYLVQGLGHCSACHSSRNALGANAGPLDLGGGLIPRQNWYAPALNAAHEAGVQAWPEAQIVTLLRSGMTDRASVSGPMAEVVWRSTQHLNDADLRAVAVYLKALPLAAPVAATADTRRSSEIGDEQARAERGKGLYATHCADCHGTQGEGVAGAYPALAGNRAVTLHTPANLVRMLTEGGFAPATAGNPRPYGMPPFGPLLQPEDSAAVLTYIRSAWGNAAPAVSAQEVARFKGGAP